MSKKSLFPIEVYSFLKKVRFSCRVKALVWMGSLWRGPSSRSNSMLSQPEV
jgi:hypothetical protein